MNSPVRDNWSRPRVLWPDSSRFSCQADAYLSQDESSQLCYGVYDIPEIAWVFLYWEVCKWARANMNQKPSIFTGFSIICTKLHSRAGIRKYTRARVSLFPDFSFYVCVFWEAFFLKYRPHSELDVGFFSLPRPAPRGVHVKIIIKSPWTSLYMAACAYKHIFTKIHSRAGQEARPRKPNKIWELLRRFSVPLAFRLKNNKKHYKYR